MVRSKNNNQISKPSSNLINLLDKTLTRAVRDICTEKKVGLMFSGGLDSSLITKILTDLNKQVILISVGAKDSRDRQYIPKAAKNFSFPLKLIVLSESVIASGVKLICQIYKEMNYKPNIMDIALGTGLYLCAKKASELKLKTLINAQGADELFGGYYKFLSVPPRELQIALKNELQKALTQSEREKRIVTKLGITLQSPFLDPRVIDLAWKIPPEFKIHKKKESKYILRLVAKNRGVPKLIWQRKKQAFQYSSRIQKHIEQILKRNSSSSKGL